MAESFDFEAWEQEYEAAQAKAVADLDKSWGIRSFRGHQTHDGYAYTCRLTRSGVVVATIEDDGRGGAPLVLWDKGWSCDDAKAFSAEATRLGFTDGMAQEQLVGVVLTAAGK